MDPYIMNIILYLNLNFNDLQSTGFEDMLNIPNADEKKEKVELICYQIMLLTWLNFSAQLYKRGSLVPIELFKMLNQSMCNVIHSKSFMTNNVYKIVIICNYYLIV